MFELVKKPSWERLRKLGVEINRKGMESVYFDLGGLETDIGTNANLMDLAIKDIKMSSFHASFRVFEGKFYCEPCTRGRPVCRLLGRGLSQPKEHYRLADGDVSNLNCGHFSAWPL